MKAKKALFFNVALTLMAILSPISHLSAAPLSTLSLTLNFPLMMNNYIGPPPLSTSYYLERTDNMSVLGCIKGTEDKSSKEARNSIVILDYGGIWNNGIYNGALGWPYFISNSAIISDTETFAHGYFNCVYPNLANLLIVIGTNTSTIQSNNFNLSDHGAAWADIVHSVNNWLANNGFSSKITAAGGNDIELPWSSVSPVVNWITGFNQNSMGTVDHFNFGNAVDCQVGSDNCYIDNNNGIWWTKHDVYNVSFGASIPLWGETMWPFPEIYNINHVNITYNNAQQWYSVDKYSHDHEQYQMPFQAVLSTLQACQQQNPPCDPILKPYTSPDRAWFELNRRLAADPDTNQFNIPWLSDIKWYY